MATNNRTKDQLLEELTDEAHALLSKASEALASWFGY